jgi:hypothetical protein
MKNDPNGKTLKSAGPYKILRTCIEKGLGQRLSLAKSNSTRLSTVHYTSLAKHSALTKLNNSDATFHVKITLNHQTYPQIK